MLFLDASALSKVYLDEYGSSVVRGALKRCAGSLFLSDYVALEVLTTLRTRLRHASGVRYSEKVEGFWADFPSKYNVLEVGPAVRKSAFEITRRERRARARSMDVLHIATAVNLQREFPREEVRMVTSDRDLGALSRECGLRTFDPSREPLAALPARRR